MVTRILRVDATNPDPIAIAEAAACLRDGGLVAFPTETVYGLGVHALDRNAVRRLFAAKRRPANDPLIVHVDTVAAIDALVLRLPSEAYALAARFWPGPLTMVLPRSPLVPDEVTAGLDSVAVRVPAHPVARALIAAAGVPIAAPSANLFSRPSPTEAGHVLADLDGQIDMIVDGGPTPVGVESTVIDLSRAPARVLRPGAVGIEAIRVLIPTAEAPEVTASDDSAAPSPGLLSKHYAPHASLTVYRGARQPALEALEQHARRLSSAGTCVALMTFEEDRLRLADVPALFISLGSEHAPDDVARRLYAALRECDARGAQVVLTRALATAHPLGAAIADRLRRAASQVVEVSQ